MRVIGLGYHDVVPRAERASSGFRGPGPDRYKVEPLAFAAHLDALEGVARPALVTTGAAVALTFDDGGAGALGHAAPLLEERGYRAHFFVVTGKIGTDGFLTQDGIRELAAAGHEIGSHSVSHPIMSRLDDAAVRDEWQRSRATLEDIVGREVRTASVPRGYAPRRVLRLAAEAGYSHVFTSEPWLAPRRIGDAYAYGRFAMTESTTPTHVAALARADRAAVARVAAPWYARKALKAVAGPAYERAREAVLRRGGARRS